MNAFVAWAVLSVIVGYLVGITFSTMLDDDQ